MTPSLTPPSPPPHPSLTLSLSPLRQRPRIIGHFTREPLANAVSAHASESLDTVHETIDLVIFVPSKAPSVTATAEQLNSHPWHTNISTVFGKRMCTTGNNDFSNMLQEQLQIRLPLKANDQNISFRCKESKQCNLKILSIQTRRFRLYTFHLTL